MKTEPMVPFAAVAMLAHELRNPLAPIVNALQVLKSRDVDADTRASACQVLARQVGCLERLINDLLQVSRVAYSKVRLQRERVSLATVIEQLAGPLRLTVDPRDKQLLIEVPARSFALYLDLVRIGQVLNNLVQNAVKFTAHGGRIWITAMPVSDGRDVAITIRDNGEGIDRTTLPHIFDLFVQGDSHAHDGLGIGLTLARELVELHGGTVVARSEGRGKGSEFCVQLPLGGEDFARQEPYPATNRGPTVVGETQSLT
jgi:signal transduction histidine kinase